MTTWFTSDQHFGHRNIIQCCNRPFSSLDQMHEGLISRHNAVVATEDDVWHLGDFAMDDRLVQTFLPLLNGRHRLVAGNHDKCHPCHRRSEAAKRKYLLYGFDGVYQEVRLGPWLLNHLPYVGDSAHEPRYPEWRPKDDGRWLLHGHVHELWKVRDRMVNVGVDQWNFAPVSLETIEKLVPDHTAEGQKQ
jgi:calcineurin-like phosphoesterase family protein